MLESTASTHIFSFGKLCTNALSASPLAMDGKRVERWGSSHHVQRSNQPVQRLGLRLGGGAGKKSLLELDALYHVLQSC